MNLNPKIDEFITEIVAVSEYLLSVDHRTDSKYSDTATVK